MLKVKEATLNTIIVSVTNTEVWLGIKEKRGNINEANKISPNKYPNLCSKGYSGGTVAQLSICSAKKKIRKVDCPWTLRPFSKLVFSKEFKNVSLLWIRLER